MTQSAVPRLETQRLVLRPLAMADAGPMTPLADDPAVSRMTTAIPHPFAQADAEGFIDRIQHADPARHRVFAVERHDGVFMGVLGLHPNNEPATELGYWLGRPYWGAGYMTEAVAAALSWAARNWGRRALTSGHFADNPASGGVLVKSGFLYTGQVEPRYSVARGETALTRMMIWLA